MKKEITKKNSKKQFFNKGKIKTEHELNIEFERILNTKFQEDRNLIHLHITNINKYTYLGKN